MQFHFKRGARQPVCDNYALTLQSGFEYTLLPYHFFISPSFFEMASNVVTNHGHELRPSWSKIYFCLKINLCLPHWNPQGCMIHRIWVCHQSFFKGSNLSHHFPPSSLMKVCKVTNRQQRSTLSCCTLPSLCKLPDFSDQSLNIIIVPTIFIIIFLKKKPTLLIIWIQNHCFWESIEIPCPLNMNSL